MSTRKLGVRRTMTPNQIVAYNVAKARALRGWTQEQAAEALAPYLGAKLSGPSFSGLERSAWTVNRIKQFSADDLLALSRGLRPADRVLLHPAATRLRRRPLRTRRRPQGPRPDRVARRHPRHPRQPRALGTRVARVLGEHRARAPQQTREAQRVSVRSRRESHAPRRATRTRAASPIVRRHRRSTRRPRTTHRTHRHPGRHDTRRHGEQDDTTRHEAVARSQAFPTDRVK